MLNLHPEILPLFDCLDSWFKYRKFRSELKSREYIIIDC